MSLLYIHTWTFHTSTRSLFTHTDDPHEHVLCMFSLMVFVVLSVSELLMGEVDSSTLLSLLPTEKSRVSERSSDDCRSVLLSNESSLSRVVDGELVCSDKPGRRRGRVQE